MEKLSQNYFILQNCFSFTFYPNLPRFLHRYICHICDISQLWQLQFQCMPVSVLRIILVHAFLFGGLAWPTGWSRNVLTECISPKSPTPPNPRKGHTILPNPHLLISSISFLETPQKSKDYKIMPDFCMGSDQIEPILGSLYAVALVHS